MSSSSYLFREKLFNHTTIHTFLNQKHASKPFGQFSVLLLVPRHAVGRQLLELKPHMPGRPYEPLLDNNYFISPHIADAVTYLAARPCGREHSEEKLISYYPKLRDNFRKFYHRLPALVILYTWLIPCKQCTDKICQTFNTNTRTIFVVVYSTGENFPGADLVYMTSELQSHGIISIKEECRCKTDEMIRSLFCDLFQNCIPLPLVPYRRIYPMWNRFDNVNNNLQTVQTRYQTLNCSRR